MDEQSKIAMERASLHWDKIAKPIKGLGELEELVIKLAGIQKKENVTINRRAVLVMCSDNGVVCEGVTQTDASVTVTMAGEIAAKKSSVCLMAETVNADVFAVDVGMNTRVATVRDMHVASGTDNIAKAPAMTREMALEAIKTGESLVKEFKDQGYEIIITGEMGIGNTTTSSAIASVLLNMEPEEVTGRGAGLSDDGLIRKINVIKKAIEINKPDKADAVDVLSKLGGFDIAALTGVFLGGKKYSIPVVLDGVISQVAALVAKRIDDTCVDIMLPSHASMEPASIKILDELKLKPIIYANMHLGEGTGAVCLLPLLDMALNVYNKSVSFLDTGIEQYEHR